MDVNDFMKRYNTINFGQVFTPPHMAEFAAELIGINDGDVVLDCCAGTGALLFAAIGQGAKEVYGIEIDESVHKTLEANLFQVEDIKYETTCDSMLNESAIEWIKTKPITKAILNPPYEKKWKTYDILQNALMSLEPGTKVALFYPDKKFEKASRKWQEWFLDNNRLLKCIKMPKGLFEPYVSVETSLFIIEAGIPQDGKDFFTCYIEDDGFVKQKKKYAADLKGKWANELKSYWLDVCRNEEGNETCKFINPAEHLSYQLPEKPFEICEEDFEITALNYICYKEGINLDEIWKDPYKRLALLKGMAGMKR